MCGHWRGDFFVVFIFSKILSASVFDPRRPTILHNPSQSLGSHCILSQIGMGVPRIDFQRIWVSGGSSAEIHPPLTTSDEKVDEFRTPSVRVQTVGLPHAAAQPAMSPAMSSVPALRPPQDWVLDQLVDAEACE